MIHAAGRVLKRRSFPNQFLAWSWDGLGDGTSPFTDSPLATVGWKPPAFDGGSPVTQSAVTSSPGGLTAATTATSTSATVTGLSNGTSTPSAPSNSVTPATVPDLPTNVMATSTSGQATVSWSAPGSDGGSALTGYTVTASPGGLTAAVGGSSLTAKVTGLTNGTTYTLP